MKSRSKLLKSVTAVSTAAVMVAQVFCSIISVSAADAVEYGAGSVNAALDSTGKYLNINGTVTDKANIKDVSVYEMPSFQDEQNMDYSSLTPIGVAGATESGGATAEEKPDYFVIEDFENGANGWVADENSNSADVKTFMSINDSIVNAMPLSGNRYFTAKKNGTQATVKSYIGKSYDGDDLLDLSDYNYLQFYFESQGGVTNKVYRVEVELVDNKNNRAAYTEEYPAWCTGNIAVTITAGLNGDALKAVDKSSIKQIRIGWYAPETEAYSGAWEGLFAVDGIIAAKAPVYPQGGNGYYSVGQGGNSFTVFETDFSTSGNGWKAGENTTSVHTEGNGYGDRSGIGVESTHQLRAVTANVRPYAFREVYKEYDENNELNLADYRRLTFDVLGSGGAAANNANENYDYRLTLKSTDGTVYIANQTVNNGGAWHTIAFNISEFAGRNKINYIGIAFALNGSMPENDAAHLWSASFTVQSMVGWKTGAPGSGAYVFSGETELFGFDTGLDGWSSGSTNIFKVERSDSNNWLNLAPFRGDGMLLFERTGDYQQFGYAEKKFEAPLNLSKARQLVYQGFAVGCGASTYYTKAVITTADGRSYEKECQLPNEMCWGTQEVDLTDMGDLSEVISIKIGGRTTSSENTHNGFYIDSIRVRGEYSIPKTDTLDNFENGLNGWTFGEQTDKHAELLVESGDTFDWGVFPATVYQGGKMLAIGKDGSTYATDPSYAKKEFSTPQDLSKYRNLSFGIFGHGGATNTDAYIAHLRLTGKDGTQKSYIQRMNSGKWTKAVFDISGFAEISQVSTIEIGYSAAEAELAERWPGRFFIDDICLTEEWKTPEERHTNGTLDESGSFAFRIPLNDVADITDKFVVAAKYKNGTVKLIEHFKYITNPEKLAANTDPYPVATSIKGVGGILADGVRMGVQHAAVNIPMDRLLTMTNHGSQSIIHYYKNQPYYFDKAFLATLDQSISSYTNNNVLIYAILLMYPNNLLDADSPNRYIKHPDGSEEANIDAVNLTDQRGVDYYGAIVSFLAERYNGDNPSCGRVVGYIVGNEITDQRVWHDMGDKSLAEFTRQYEWQLRMTNTLVKKASAAARVYVSMEHHWNSSTAEGYCGKELLETLNEYTKAAGDYGWNVAYHSYPDDITDPRTWNDNVTDDLNTKKITFKNIQVLPQFLSQDSMKYNGESRRVVLSEQGFNTRYAKLSEEEAEAEQAAGYAYAFYKIASTPGIDAFILHRHVDGESEGFRFGLWTTIEGEESQPGRQKKIYDVFKYIDTEKSREATEFALDFISKDTGKTLNNWKDIIPEFNEADMFNTICTRPAVVSANAGSPSQIDGKQTITDGTSLDNWFTKQLTKNLELADDTASSRKVVKASVVSGGWMDAEYNGITYQPAQALDLADKPVLTVTLQAENVGGYQKGVEYMIRVHSGRHVLEGTAERLGDSWQTLAVDLTGFAGIRTVDRIDIWAKPTDKYIWSLGSISVAEIAAVDATEIKNLIFTSNVDKVTANGQKVIFTVTNKGSSEINDTITFAGQNGLTLDVTSQPINLPVNKSKTFTVTVTGLDKIPENKYGAITVGLHGMSKTFQITEVDYSDYVADGDDWVLGDFEDAMTDGWIAGNYVNYVQSVTKSSKASGSPSAASHGTFCLEANRMLEVATTPSYTVKTFKKPLDLTNHSLLSVQFCGWGGTSRMYTVEIVLTASDGTQKSYRKWMQSTDIWQNYTLDISDFAKRDSVTSIAIGFYGFDKFYYTDGWNGCFYLDNIRALSGRGSLTVETEYENLLDPITTITDSAGKVAVSGLSVLPGSQLTKAEYVTSGSVYDNAAQLAKQFKQAKLMGVYDLQAEYAEEEYTPIGAVEICLPLPTGYSAKKQYMLAHTLSDGTVSYIFPKAENGSFKFTAAGMGTFSVLSADSESAFRVAE